MGKIFKNQQITSCVIFFMYVYIYIIINIYLYIYIHTYINDSSMIVTLLLGVDTKGQIRVCHFGKQHYIYEQFFYY